MIQIKIPNYLKRVKLSESRRPKYLRIKDGPLPEKYNTPRYVWKKKLGETRLFDTEKKEFVLKNPKAANTPSYQTIAGNEIYARMHERKRMLIVNNLKDDFKQHISEQLRYIPQDLFPISVSMEVHTPYGYADWDVDNLWIYHKCFLDSLRDLQLVPDDSILHVRQAGQTTFIPVLPSEIPMMIFKIDTAPAETNPATDGILNVTESCDGEPGEIFVDATNVILYTGKSKVIYGAAKKAIRSAMTYALNNFKTMFVPVDIYDRYRNFFEEADYSGKVKIIKTTGWKN